MRTLRELGLDLATVHQVLHRQATVADVARAHARALDAEIRTLQLRRAVLRSVAQRGSTTEEMRLMHKLARLSVQQRQRIIDDFVQEAFGGIAEDSPGAHIAQAMRQLPAELPTDPTPAQVDAWVELAELVDDTDFRQRVRQMAVAGAAPEPAGGASQAPGYDPALVVEHAGAAVAAGVAPQTAQAEAILSRILGTGPPPVDRARLAEHLRTFTDRRVERYWQLMGVLNGRAPFPSTVAAFEWLIAALRAHP